MQVKSRDRRFESALDPVLHAQDARLKQPDPAMNGPTRQPPVTIVCARNPQTLTLV